VLGGSLSEFLGWTPANVKLLLPPRQSRGNSRYIRKGDELINVNFTDGGYSTLHARGFTLETSSDRIALSIDLSPNQRVRKKDSNCVLDVRELIENPGRVENFELSDDKWLSPLARAVVQNREASQEIELRFKAEPSHTFTGRWQGPTPNVLFLVEP